MTGPRLARLAGTLAVLAACLGGCATDNSTTVPGPTTEEASQAATELAEATAVQAMCYGWNLNGSYRGSNLGGSAAVDSDPAKCPEWVEVVADVTYTSASSESNDYATLSVETNSSRVDEYDLLDRLRTMGFSESRLIDEPGFAILHAAMTLPLVAAESGAATPMPVTGVSAAPVASVEPLPSAGNDFLRDRWAYMLTSSILIVVGVAVAVFAAWERARSKPAAWSKPGVGTRPQAGSNGPAGPKASR